MLGLVKPALAPISSATAPLEQMHDDEASSDESIQALHDEQHVYHWSSIRSPNCVSRNTALLAAATTPPSTEGVPGTRRVSGASRSQQQVPPSTVVPAR